MVSPHRTHARRARRSGRSDRIVGVSECIILGTPVQIGTGAFKVLFADESPAPVPRRRPLLRVNDSVRRLNIFGGT